MQAVDVMARNVATNRGASATTDDEGRFRIVGLQSGHYTVEVTDPGLTSLAVANVVVEVGRATTVEVSLDSGTVDAPTHMPGIDATRQDFSVSLNQTSFNNLPNNGRRWSNFAILAPATAPDGPFRRGQFSRHQQPLERTHHRWRRQRSGAPGERARRHTHRLWDRSRLDW